ncbi:SUMF1/EgtB/PvdO family nonheme iron enzyme [Clostridium thermosuccinogenes]
MRNAFQKLKDKDYLNSLSMKMVRIEPGSFYMGSETGDLDESPVHKVTISKPFYMSAYEVTNKQYEEYDPTHKLLRGKLGFSKEDDEAVVFVSWHDAMGFCKWLSEKEGLPYRLPTEAEWEYAARAGTTTDFHTGNSLPDIYHKNQRESWYPETEPGKVHPGDVMPLTVGLTPPNPWGLYDMHGNVEEWCLDWYGPYESYDQVDPVGRENGEFRVTRGGSHSSDVYYLRSSNRMGTLPEDKHWLIGFRVVCGEMPQTVALPITSPERYQLNVRQEVPNDIHDGPDKEKPFFSTPRRYVILKPDAKGPFFHHNHSPAITECPNGDLLAIWFTCERESGREMAIAASRLRYGCDEWEEASIFWNPPDRNVTGSALLVNEEGTIFHFNGLGASATWANLALVMRTSADNGVTWSKAKVINSEHGLCNMPIASAFQTKSGAIILPCDAVTGGEGGTVIHVSMDGGERWERRESWILGIHASVVELKDGRLLAFGRGNSINGMMPKSISDDMGKSWVYSASGFQPISMGQRAILMRLKEGPLFFASFGKDMVFTDNLGRSYTGSGLYAALSFDEGESWPILKLISDCSGKELDGGAWTGKFRMTYNNAEPKGYLAAVQAKNGLIHLISSALHYSFNLKWLMTPPARPGEY